MRGYSRICKGAARPCAPFIEIIVCRTIHSRSRVSDSVYYYLLIDIATCISIREVRRDIVASHEHIFSSLVAVVTFGLKQRTWLILEYERERESAYYYTIAIETIRAKYRE